MSGPFYFAPGRSATLVCTASGHDCRETGLCEAGTWTWGICLCL